MRSLVLVLACATLAWSTPIAITTDTFTTCTNGSGAIVSGPDSCQIGDDASNPLGAASAVAYANGRYDGNGYATMSTGVQVTEYQPGDTQIADGYGSARANMILHLTTGGPIRDGRFLARVASEGTGGTVNVQWGDSIAFHDFGGFGGTYRSEDFNFIAPLGKPFQITLDNLMENWGPRYGWGQTVEIDFAAFEIGTGAEVAIIPYDPVSETPEPSSVLLIGSGLLACLYRLRNHKVNRG